MTGDGPLGPRPAVLQAGDDAVRGTFDDRSPMLFLLPEGSDLDRVARIAGGEGPVVWWADGRARYDAPVAVTSVDARRNEVALELRGPVLRIQRRREVRAPARLRCLVLALEGDGVVTSPATTSNLSGGGAAITLDRDCDVGGRATIEAGDEIGVVLVLADRRIGAVAHVLAARRRAGRVELRVRFGAVDRSDARDLASALASMVARRPG